MGGYARTRTRDQRGYLTGSYTDKVTPSLSRTGTGRPGVYQTTTDVVGNKSYVRKPKRKRRKPFKYKPNAFTSVKDFVEIGVVHGKRADGNREFSNYPVDYQPSPTDPIIAFGDLDANALSAKALEIVSKSNPSAPDVSLPTFVAELQEVPSLVRSWGGQQFMTAFRRINKYARPSLRHSLDIVLKREFSKGLTKRNAISDAAYKASEAYLTYRWVIKPTLSELSTMINFMALVDQRVKTLEGLRTHRTSNQRVRLESATVEVEAPTSVAVQSLGALVYCKRSKTASAREWGSVQWNVQQGTNLPKDSGEMRKLARRLVLGQTNFEALAAAWELLPWSWFIDWFASVGTFVRAANNTVGLTFSEVCYMRHSWCQTRYTYEPTLAPNGAWAKLVRVPSERRDRKIRKVGLTVTNPFPPVSTPFLNGKCWSVLGSLRVLKDFKDQRGLLSKR